MDDEVISVDTDLIAKEASECPSGTGPPEGALKADMNISNDAAIAS